MVVVAAEAALVVRRVVVVGVVLLDNHGRDGGRRRAEDRWGAPPFPGALADPGDGHGVLRHGWVEEIHTVRVAPAARSVWARVDIVYG